MKSLMKIGSVLVIACACAAAMPTLGAPGPRGGGGGGGAQPTRSQIRLEARTAVPATLIRGKAAYRSENRDGVVRESLSVEVQGAVPGTTYVVTIAGRNFGTITIGGLGTGKLDLASGGDDANQVAPMLLRAGDAVQIGTMQGVLAVR